MGRVKRWSIGVFYLICLVGSGLTHARQMNHVKSDGMIICPAVGGQSAPPDFRGPDCRAAIFTDINPQNKAIWVKSRLTLDDKVLHDQQPYALYVFAKTSSRIYFNGQLLGESGSPGSNSADEVVGEMDSRFYVPPALLNQIDNEVVMHLSSFNGFLTLHTPVHFVALGPYGFFDHLRQQNRWLSLIPLGALILGVLYFAVLSVNNNATPSQRQTHRLFFIMAILAASQLFAEVSRLLFAYPYPVHDLRLMLIICFSLGFGGCLLFYIVNKFATQRHNSWLLGSAVLTLSGVILINGFDSKTAVAILIPTLVSTVLIGIEAFKRKDKVTWTYFIVFVLFTLTTIMTLGYFHDSVFYYIITGVLCFLFIQQALELGKEQQKRRTEEEQVAKLQFKLDQNSQKATPEKIKLTSAGKIEFVSSDLITYCKAAGDYVELFFCDQRQRLYSGNLKDLQSQLPSTFLRVHRSYLVNTDYIKSLEKTASDAQKAPAGGGFLLLQGGFEVPVSRRIMPTVRSVL